MDKWLLEMCHTTIENHYFRGLFTAYGIMGSAIVSINGLPIIYVYKPPLRQKM